MEIEVAETELEVERCEVRFGMDIMSSSDVIGRSDEDTGPNRFCF